MDQHDYLMARARFKDTHCNTCLNVGVLRVAIEDYGTLCLCDCTAGHQQPWELPRLSSLKDTPRHKPLKWEDFHPGIHAKSLDPEDMQSFIPERTKWWREKVRTAEEYFKSRGK